jgi:phosphoribosylformylglycinamidine synthase
VVLLGDCTDELGGSEYLNTIHGVVAGAPPRVHLAGERAVVELLHAAITAGHVASAHDVSDGGLCVALAECCVGHATTRVGAAVQLTAFDALPVRAVRFGEAQGRVVLATAAPEAVLALAQQHGVPARVIGATHAEPTLVVTDHGTTWSARLEVLAEAFHEAIPRRMTRPATAAAEG